MNTNSKSLEAGDFDEQLLRQIERCDYFILLLTEGALNRPFVQREINHALKHNKKVISIIDKDSSYQNFLPESLKRFQNIKTDTEDTNQIDFVVQQLENYMRKPQPLWQSKPLLIGVLILSFVVGVFAYQNMQPVSEGEMEDDTKKNPVGESYDNQINMHSGNNSVTAVTNSGDDVLITPVIGNNNSVNIQFNDNGIHDSFVDGNIENNTSITQIQRSSFKQSSR